MHDAPPWRVAAFVLLIEFTFFECAENSRGDPAARRWSCYRLYARGLRFYSAASRGPWPRSRRSISIRSAAASAITVPGPKIAFAPAA